MLIAPSITSLTKTGRCSVKHHCGGPFCFRRTTVLMGRVIAAPTPGRCDLSLPRGTLFTNFCQEERLAKVDLQMVLIPQESKRFAFASGMFYTVEIAEQINDCLFGLKSHYFILKQNGLYAYS